MHLFKTVPKLALILAVGTLPLAACSSTSTRENADNEPPYTTTVAPQAGGGAAGSPGPADAFNLSGGETYEGENLTMTVGEREIRENPNYDPEAAEMGVEVPEHYTYMPLTVENTSEEPKDFDSLLAFSLSDPEGRQVGFVGPTFDAVSNRVLKPGETAKGALGADVVDGPIYAEYANLNAPTPYAAAGWSLECQDELPGSYEPPEDLNQSSGSAAEHGMGEAHEWNGLRVTVGQLEETEGQYESSYRVPISVENISEEAKSFDPYTDLYPYAGEEPIFDASPEGDIASLSEVEPGESADGYYTMRYSGSEPPVMRWEPYNQGASLFVAYWPLSL